MECSICCECIVDNGCNKIKPYTCDHMFHSDCINNWNGTCPNCRSPLKYAKTKNAYFHNMYASLKDRELPVSRYEHKRQMCVHDNHTLKVCRSGLPPFGAMLFCFHCEDITCCNLILT